MNTVEFFLLLTDKINYYFISLILVGIVYFIVLKPLWKGILDPIFLSWIGSTFASSVVVFLWITNSIKSFYFIVFLITQVFFFIGFYLGNKQKKKLRIFHTKIREFSLFSECFYIVLILICCIFQLLQYALVGIPLFMDSRLEAGMTGGGLGIIVRILGVTSFIALFMTFYYIKATENAQLRIIALIFLVFSLSTSLLSGSKSSLLIFGVIFFLFVTLYRKNFRGIQRQYDKSLYKLLILGVLGIIFFFWFKVGGNFFLIASEFGGRLVGFGDMYWMALPNSQIENIDNSKPFYALFSSILGSFRLVPYEELPQALGFELVSLVNGIKNPTFGPNARLNLFSYLYFGIVGGTFFSYLCGYIGGYIRSIFFRSSRVPVLIGALLAWLYKSASSLETDPTMLIFNINSFIMIFPILFLMSWGLFLIVKLQKVKK